MPDSVLQVMGGVYVLLRRPSDVKLNPEDVKERLNDILRGYIQDMDLGVREQRTATVTATIVEDEHDYLLTLENVPDFEPVKLEYRSSFSPFVTGWREAVVVPFRAWEQSEDWNWENIRAAFYGSSALQSGTKLKLGIPLDVFDRLEWRLSYREPLLAVMQEGMRPPIPSNHLPMLKRETAIECMPLVQDNSEEWIAWMERTLPIYTAALAQDKERWKEYLSTSVEPQVVPMPRFDDFRRQDWRGRSARGYLPRQ